MSTFIAILISFFTFYLILWWSLIQVHRMNPIEFFIFLINDVINNVNNKKDGN